MIAAARLGALVVATRLLLVTITIAVLVFAGGFVRGRMMAALVLVAAACMAVGDAVHAMFAIDWFHLIITLAIGSHL